MNIRNSSLTMLAALSMCVPDNAAAQQTTHSKVIHKTEDKATADAKVFDMLSSYSGGRLLTKVLDFSQSKLTDTNEDNIKIAEGTWFQVNSLRSDIYVDNKTRRPVFGKQYPMESAVNLLMNTINNDSHRITIIHHQYGNVKKKVMLPLHAIYQVLATDKDIYCSVTKIDPDNIEANLVMHQPESDYIHMFIVRIPIKELFKSEGMFTAELYSNIPQNNVTSIYSNKEIKEIWKSSAMSCPPMNLNCRCLKTSDGYQVRGIPVDILAADGDEARQELTINFDTEGTISNVAIAIEMNRYEELMAQKQSDLDYARRQIIVDFIENFRTAYNRKDNAMLNSVFSDKALIITGRVVKEKPNSDLTRLTLNNNRVVYIKQTKQEYLTKLAQVFKTVKFINVKFSDIEIVEHPKFDSIYGVTLKQSWRTDRYHDEGYLFLMIDFRDSDNPLIQVRTWQPYKDAAGNIVTQKDEVFHLGSFRIVR